MGICVKFILILSWFEVVCKYNEKCHCLYSIVVFKYFSILSFMGKCAKVWYISTDHSRQYHTAHAPCMLHNYSYGHTLTICNDHCCWLHESTSSELQTYIAFLVKIREILNYTIRPTIHAVTLTFRFKQRYQPPTLSSVI